MINAINKSHTTNNNDINWRAPNLPSPRKQSSGILIVSGSLDFRSSMKDMVLDDPTSSSETADRISRLPEDVILRILFFLSVKDAARTSVLSKTWQHIWALLPVFSFCSDALLRQGNLLYASFDANKYMDLVDKSLEELRHCKVRIKRFQIHLFEIQRHASRFNQFMELANRNQVEELVVHGLVSTLDLKKPSLPLATFASTNTFKVLDLKACVLTPELLKDEPRFPCLTKLSLFKVNYSRMDQMVENLLANCHLLKEFFLEDCEVERVKLDHPKLERVRILGVVPCLPLERLEISSLQLRYLMLCTSPGRAPNEVEVEVDAPNLQLYECLCLDSTAEAILSPVFINTASPPVTVLTVTKTLNLTTQCFFDLKNNLKSVEYSLVVVRVKCDIDSADQPVNVECLKVACYLKSFDYEAFLDCCLLICRPKTIFIESNCDSSIGFIELLRGKLIPWEEGLQCCGNSQRKCWRHCLEVVKIWNTKPVTLQLNLKILGQKRKAIGDSLPNWLRRALDEQRLCTFVFLESLAACFCSGTDDDLPSSHQNRFQRGGRTAAGNGRSAVVGSVGNGRSAVAHLPRIHGGDMETQIHLIEQEAYSSVLRAFKAQSDALTWEKESLITELRKELRVSDEEHRDLLSRVNADDMIRRIREWRMAGGLHPGMLSTSQPIRDPAPSPTVSGSRKRQKTSQSVASLSMVAPSPALLPSMQPSSSALRRGPPPGGKSKKSKSYPSTGFPGRPQASSRMSSGAFAANEPAEAAQYDPLIGRKVWTRWPEDNHFYEAVITDYNRVEGRHALVYDINTANETWEWVNLKEISPEDIRWEGNDPGISHRGGRPGPGLGIKKSMGHGGAVVGAGRGRGSIKGQVKKNFPLAQNGVGKKVLGDIEILHTDTLIKEVEKVFGVTHPDPIEIEKAKKVLSEHEQALLDAIARLEDASDGESDGGHPFLARTINGSTKSMEKTAV
ncbi:hypothetical protein V6N12_015896 [Hibiscus sabdariffa]|uniref:Uncharacterized protein n=1 Tax=Hibiscus sabdariffa TaxID=183260 RepID=A0ABR2DPF7_9ROSI